MPERATLLVAEIFDSILLGEGVLGTMRHAVTELGVQGHCRVVPARATIHAQLLASSVLAEWRDTRQTVYGALDVAGGPCTGATASVEVQSDAIESQVHPLSPPFDVFSFDLAAPPDAKGRQVRSRRRARPLALRESRPGRCIGHPRCSSSPSFQCTLRVPLIDEGTATAVACWFTLYLAPGATLSTAPSWIRRSRDSNRSGDNCNSGRSSCTGTDCDGWRDHWTTPIFLLPARAVHGSADLSVGHDDFAVWFRWADASAPDRPLCSCTAHALLPAPRLWALHDAVRASALRAALRLALCDAPRGDYVLLAGDGVGLLPALLPPDHASRLRWIAVEQREAFRRLPLPACLDPVSVVLDLRPCEKLELPPELTASGAAAALFAAEPYFVATQLPWHEIRLWFIRSALRRYIDGHPETAVDAVPAAVATSTTTRAHASGIAEAASGCGGTGIDAALGAGECPSSADAIATVASGGGDPMRDSIQCGSGDDGRERRVDGCVARVLPRRARLRAQLVLFERLWRSHAPLDGPVCGFDLSALDAVRLRPRPAADLVLAHSVWQYAYAPLGEPATLLSFDFACPEVAACTGPTVRWPIAHDAAAGDLLCRGAVLLWMDYELDNEGTICLSGRPTRPWLRNASAATRGTIDVGYCTRQGVLFLCMLTGPRDPAPSQLSITAAFSASTGDVDFSVSLQ